MRPRIKEYLLNKINTGNVSRHAYGTHIRKVEVSRGNREGNNAFLHEFHVSGDVPDIFKSKTKWQVYRKITVNFFKAFTLTSLGKNSDLQPDGDDGIRA